MLFSSITDLEMLTRFQDFLTCALPLCYFGISLEKDNDSKKNDSLDCFPDTFLDPLIPGEIFSRSA
jgi:hypothetical protein